MLASLYLVPFEMNRLISFPSFLFFILVTGLAAQTINAEVGIDVEYSDHMPLVTKSVLLDITRSGDTLVAVGERGHVVISTDGDNWKQVDVVPTRSTLTSVVAVSGRLWAAGHDAVIITSGDGGQTWSRQFYDPDRQQAVMDIFFSDENHGVAIGSYGLFLQTSDGGQHWEEAVVDEENDYHLNSLIVFSDDRRMIAGEAGFSYRSYDGGASWEAINVPYPGSMWGAIRTAGECVLFYGLRGHVMESCDFGDSWTELDTGSESSISGAAEDDGMILLAANSGTLLTRTDGGGFAVYQHSSGGDFAAALKLDDGSFLLVGEDGVQRYPETDKQGENND